MAEKNKKAISPVISTVLLISIAIVLALIVFLYFRSLTKEIWEKEDMPPYQACDEVELDVSYDSIGGTLQVSNMGNIPVFSLEILKTKGGDTEREPESQSLAVGESSPLIDIGTGYDEIKVHPVLLGQGETSKLTRICSDKEFIAEE